MNDLKTLQIKTVTLNVRGLNRSTKRRSIFRWLHSQKAHFYFLQETYSDEKSKAFWEAEWGGKIFCSHGTKHSKGVMILPNPKYDIEVTKVEKDNNGRLIVLVTKMNDANLVLMNLYSPNDISQQVQFFDKVMNKLSNYAGENIIVGGDFNCALTESDKIGGKPVENKKRVRDKITQLCDLYDLQDIWREMNPKKKQFTWRDKAYKVQCRLDYFLASQNLANLTKECSIVHAPGSDHCAVKLFIQSDSLNKKAGPGFWKFNSSLLEDEDYINEFKANIENYRNKYLYLDDKGLRWDLMKMEIRGFTIAYAKRKAKKKRNEEKKLEEQLNELLGQSAQCKTNPHLRTKIQSIQMRLKRITDQKVKGAILRSKARWVEYGEKNTRYFLNLEKKKGEKKTIIKLKLNDEMETEDQEIILREEENFYRALYESSNINIATPESNTFFENELINPLSDKNANICEGKITKEECKKALNEMGIGKSPGSDGLTSEFYKRFWDVVGEDVVKSINNAFDKGELSICQKRGIITLLPKKDKPTDVLNNLRPVTLLNVDYKIATKVIANRLAKVLPDIISPNQTGYVKNRYIGENVRLISDVIDYTKAKQTHGIALFLDFKKAFDSIEWEYLHKVLDVFNFKRDFKRWVKVFYTDISSCVTNNGFASPFFNLKRGVRQGCPLSGLLFVLGIELLNLAFQTNSNIKGIKVGDEEIKNTLYADDTTLFLRDLDSVQTLLETLENFRSCSGLELNKSKTEAMWLGCWATRKDTPYGFRWPENSVYALGIHFSNEK